MTKDCFKKNVIFLSYNCDDLNSLSMKMSY